MSRSGDTGWRDQLGGLMQDRLEWNVSFNYDLGGNSVSAGMNGLAKWSWRTFATPPPDPPGPLPAPPANGSITATGGVSTDGSYNFNPPNLIFWGKSSFGFDLW